MKKEKIPHCQNILKTHAKIHEN